MSLSADDGSVACAFARGKDFSKEAWEIRSWSFRRSVSVNVEDGSVAPALGSSAMGWADSASDCRRRCIALSSSPSSGLGMEEVELNDLEDGFGKWIERRSRCRGIDSASPDRMSRLDSTESQFRSAKIKIYLQFQNK